MKVYENQWKANNMGAQMFLNFPIWPPASKGGCAGGCAGVVRGLCGHFGALGLISTICKPRCVASAGPCCPQAKISRSCYNSEYIYGYIHIYIYIYKYIPLHSHIFQHLHTRIYTYIYPHVCLKIHENS